jgi:hypothetical protein
MPRIRDKLADWSHAELVERMVHREPQLQLMLETPPPGRASVVLAGDIQVQVRQGFGMASRGGWRQSQALACQLEDLAELGLAHSERAEPANGITILATLVAEISDHYHLIHDDDGDVGRVIDQCVVSLEQCLASAEPAPRTVAVRALATAMIWGEGYGVGRRAVEVIDAIATPDERGLAIELLEGRLAGETNEWARKALGKLLLRLRGVDADPASALDLLRRTGNRAEVVRRLLELHQPQQAAEVLADAPWVEVPELADAFKAHGYPREARDALEAILAKRRDQGCWLAMQWLHQLAVELGEPEPRRRWAVELFWEAPSADRWKLVRDAMKERERRPLRQRLREEGRYLMLTRILLSEGRHKAKEARNVLRLADPKDPETSKLGVHVAEALAGRKPREAADLWRAEAERLCSYGNPHAYEEAVDLIMKGRAALLAAGHPRLATEYLAAFQASHRARGTLQALLARRLDDG